MAIVQARVQECKLEAQAHERSRRAISPSSRGPSDAKRRWADASDKYMTPEDYMKVVDHHSLSSSFFYLMAPSANFTEHSLPAFFIELLSEHLQRPFSFLFLSSLVLGAFSLCSCYHPLSCTARFRHSTLYIFIVSTELYLC